MRKADFTLNMSVSVEMNILRLHRWINRVLASDVKPRIASGSSRLRMAYRANAKRAEANPMFPFNPTRNPRRTRR
jgi:hypothetical protein